MRKWTPWILTLALGIGIGASVASELKNGLYVFKSGDPILASEVNANFELLHAKIAALETKVARYEATGVLDPIVGAWSCTPEGAGSAGFAVFKADGGLASDGVRVYNGIPSSWARVSANLYLATGNGGGNRLNVTFSDANSKMRVVREILVLSPLDTPLNCVRV